MPESEYGAAGDSAAGKNTPRIVIIGAGMSGILMGYRLLKAGIRSFTIFEKAQKPGGTWRENTYPGIACDVPSHNYSYTFAPNADWSARNAGGAEIQSYFEQTAKKYGVRDHIRLNSEVMRSEWTGGAWRIETRDGKLLEADILISAAGVLHHPQYPDIPGREDFAGKMFHTARWDHAVDMQGKRVGIIGTGSTSSQIIPALIDSVEKFSVFQRTAQWIHPLHNKPYSEQTKRMFRRYPSLMRALYNWYSFRQEEFFSKAVVGGKIRLALLDRGCRRNLAQVKDPGLRRKLTPDYAPGCKRLIFSDTFYEAIQKPNADLVTDPIDHIEPRGVVTKDGRLHELDVLILSTGFKADRFMRPMEMVGEDGVTLSQAWEQGPRAYRSIGVPGMPNFFMLIGPHSPIGNLSLITIAEKQADYIMKCVDTIRRRKVAMAPKEAAVGALLARMKEAAKQTVWSSGCQSWYLDEDGVPGIYPWASGRFFREMKPGPNLGDFELKPLPPGSPLQDSSGRSTHAPESMDAFGAAPRALELP